MGYREEKIIEFEKKKKLLIDMLKTNRDQMRRQLSDAEKLALQEECLYLEAEYEKCVLTIERWLNGERSLIPPDQLRSELVISMHRKLSLIDFADAENAFRGLLGQFQDCDGALVMIQSSEHRMGTLYLKRVRELLISKGGMHLLPTITFTRNEKTTKDELISRLYQSAGMSLSNVGESDSSRLVQLAQRLFSAVDAGRTLFLEICCEEMDTAFIKWVLHDFWKVFRDELMQAGHHKGRLRVVVILVAHFEFTCDDELNPFICREINRFQNQMIYEISLLTQWEEVYIKDWLYEQLADVFDYYGYPRSDLPKLASRVMQLTNGIPRQVCNEITGTTLDWLMRQLIPASIAS